MTITNKSGKIIGIAGRAILPGETGSVPDSYKTNGILEMLSKDPDLTIEQVEPAVSAQTEQAALKTGKPTTQPAAKTDEKG